VFLDGSFTDAQTLRDHLVRVSFADQFCDFALTRRQHRRRQVGLVDGSLPAQAAALFRDVAPIADAQIDRERLIDVARMLAGDRFENRPAQSPKTLRSSARESLRFDSIIAPARSLRSSQ
jgi:hypothetical protein